MRYLRVLGVLLAVGMAGLAVAAWAADYTVAQSNVPDLPAGAKLTKSTAITLPDGGEILLADAKGRQRLCAGPYKGAVSGCKGGAECSALGKLLGQCGSAGPVSGGTRDLKQP